MKLTIDFDKYKDLELSNKLIMAYLDNYYHEEIEKDNFTYFTNSCYPWVLLPVKTMEIDLGLTPFKQRNCLNDLCAVGYISLRFGHTRSRYFRVPDSKFPSRKARLLSKIKKMSAKDVCKMLHNVRFEDDEF